MNARLELRVVVLTERQARELVRDTVAAVLAAQEHAAAQRRRALTLRERLRLFGFWRRTP